MLNEFLKYGVTILTPLLVKFFNTFLQSTKIPKDWNRSYTSISNIYQSGDKSNCGNYRGISICSIIGKLFSKIMRVRLNKKLENENIISKKNQAGFRKKLQNF